MYEQTYAEMEMAVDKLSEAYERRVAKLNLGASPYSEQDDAEAEEEEWQAGTA